MKKIINMFSAALMLALALSVLMPANLRANEINVTINGQEVLFEGQGPVIVDGRTLVPVLGVFENLNFEVDWVQATQTAVLTSADHAVVISVGSNVFTENGESHALEVPAQVINGRTMLPIRNVLESVGYYVDWDGTASTVIISSQPPLAAADPRLEFDLPNDIAPDINAILHVLYQGAARADVEGVLGAVSQRVFDGHGNEFSYRYDTLTHPDYTFINPDDIDNVDIDGLSEGKARIIAFVYYDAQDEVSQYIIYYSTLEGSIYEIRRFPEGFDITHRHRKIY